jgi:hypothetical protein
MFIIRLLYVAAGFIARARLVHVRDGVIDETRDVLVQQPVANLFTVALAIYEARTPQHPQMLGHQ